MKGYVITQVVTRKRYVIMRVAEAAKALFWNRRNGCWILDINQAKVYRSRAEASRVVETAFPSLIGRREDTGWTGEDGSVVSVEELV